MWTVSFHSSLLKSNGDPIGSCPAQGRYDLLREPAKLEVAARLQDHLTLMQTIPLGQPRLDLGHMWRAARRPTINLEGKVG